MPNLTAIRRWDSPWALSAAICSMVAWPFGGVPEPRSHLAGRNLAKEIMLQAFTPASCTPPGAKAVPLLEEVQKTAPEKSLLGRMAADFLLLR